MGENSVFFCFRGPIQKPNVEKIFEKYAIKQEKSSELVGSIVLHFGVVKSWGGGGGSISPA